TFGNSIVVAGTRNFDANVVDSTPFTVVGEVVVNTLICISPNSSTKGKPGSWVQKHGFTGSCNDASTAAGLGFIPSSNNPTTDPDTTF
nr:hypothetical protein [Actinomycetota bacterium]